MDHRDALRGGGKVVPLRPQTIDDGVIRLGSELVEELNGELLALAEGEALERLQV
jgi:hypothetical protein